MRKNSSVKWQPDKQGQSSNNQQEKPLATVRSMKPVAAMPPQPGSEEDNLETTPPLQRIVENMPGILMEYV